MLNAARQVVESLGGGGPSPSKEALRLVWSCYGRLSINTAAVLNISQDFLTEDLHVRDEVLSAVVLRDPSAPSRLFLTGRAQRPRVEREAGARSSS